MQFSRTNKLKPPQNFFSNPNDLCEFYKSKVGRLETKFQELWELLDRFALGYNENSKLQYELQSRNSQVSQLQLSLSDLQVFLFREREENLRLAAENDVLRIEDFENKKCIDVLLKLSGITRDQLRDLLVSHKKHKNEEEKNKTSGKTSRRSTGRSEVTKPKSDKSVITQDSLVLQIKSLKTQLENLRVLFRTEVDVLLKDREVIAEERQTETRKYSAHMENLTKKLAKAQSDVQEASRRLLQEQKEREDDVEKLRNEKDELYKYVVPLTARSHETEYNTLTGFGATSNKCRCGNKKQLLDRVSEQERLTNIYQRQCKQLEIEMKKWKEKAQIADTVLQQKTQHLTADLAVMRNRCEDLDRRRLLEAEGFRTDIRMLRERLKELDKKLEKMKQSNGSGGLNTHNEDMKITSQKTLERAKQLEKEVLALKHKFTLFMQE